MYNLYRAWFGDESYPYLETFSPPDTIIRVGNEGEHHFAAHRSVLAAHSGYLKALLSATNTNSMAPHSYRDGVSSVTSLSVPSVGGETFVPLLNYMYTGRLEVTLDNIYSVLLATHLLHMPGALEQCRTALLRLQGRPPPLPSCEPSLTSSELQFGSAIVRPVPNRIITSPLSWRQNDIYSSTFVGFSHLSNLQYFRGNNIPVMPTSSQVFESGTNTNLYNRSLTTSPTHLLNNQVPQKGLITNSVCLDQPEASKDISCSDTFQDLKENKYSQSIKSPANLPRKERNLHLESSIQFNNERTNVIQLDNEHDVSELSSLGVTLDIACCDGPIKFHRVLNQNYITSSSRLQQQQQPQLLLKASSYSSVDNQVSFEENDENGRPNDTLEVDETVESTSGSSGSCKCSSCSNSFKSQYCYKKHKKKHIMPTENEMNQQTDRARRREVRLLDLNVQYYPCKICGSKFPSYYFVHKHKKLCHSGSDEQNSEEGHSHLLHVANGSNTEIY